MMTKYSRPLTIGLLCLLGFLIYFNSLSTPFQFDDSDYITGNPAFRDVTVAAAIWERRWIQARFLSLWSFAANYRLGGLEPYGYHLVNVLIHSRAAAVVWWLMTLLTGADGLAANLLPVFVGLLFLCHPIQ